MAIARTHKWLAMSLGLASVTVLSACKGKEPTESKVTTLEPAAALTAPRPRSDEPLASRLSREADSRPVRGIRADDVFSALRMDGVNIVRTRQVLGETLGASYCETGLTNKGVSLAVCEFSDAQAAEQGRARSKALFDKVIKNRVLATNGQTLLTVVAPSATELETQRLIQRFAAL